MMEKAKKPKPNFRRWILGMISFSIGFVGPVVISLGYQAYNFNVKILTADRALMGIGCLFVMQGIVTLIACILNKHSFFVFSFYSSILLNVFNSIFALGVWLLMEDMVDWIDTNWDDLRKNLSGYDMASFKSHATSEVQSLLVFSLIECFLLLTSMVIVWTMIPKHITKTLLPVTSLILSVLGSALILVSLYAGQHSSYTELPIWSAYIFTLIGIVEIGLGFFGYKAAVSNARPRIVVFTIILGLVSVVAVTAGVSFILNSNVVPDYLNDHWPEISANLEEAGYEVSEEEFAQLLKMNFKFSGLFGFVNFVYIVLSFVGAIMYLRMLRKNNLLPNIF